MIGSSRLFRLLALGAIAATVSGCATVAARSSPVDPDAAPAEVEGGPQVRIWTTDEHSSLARVRPVIRLEEDAYVVVVNVGLDGYANVLFPESPDDDGFMRGGRTYRLPSFFPGFANHFHRTQYGRLHNATSAYDDIYDRYAGYVFVIASWRPMHFQIAEALGLWNDNRLAVHERRLDPYHVMHDYAARLVPGRRDYTARFARYAAIGDRFASASALSHCALYGPVVGYAPWWLLQTGFAFIPTYGFGYYGGGSSCGLGYATALNTWRPVIRRPIGRPPRPPAVDTAAKPREPRLPRVEKGDTTERKSARQPRRAEAETDAIVDVTRETRDLMRRRERGDGQGRVSRAPRGERGYEPASGWERGGSTWTRERVDSDSRGRGESPRSEGSRREPRSSEPRSEPRTERVREPRGEPRSEPRAEPRQESRPRETPRSEPPPRVEPRGERPPKPADRP